MIEVTLRLYGNLRRFLPEGRDTVSLSVPEDSTVRDLVETVHAQHDVWVVAINGAVVPISARVAAGDLIECFEHIEGG
jgi:sulfur carrier protein ThiS